MHKPVTCSADYWNEIAVYTLS